MGVRFAPERLVCAAALLLACASRPQSPFYGDERFLVVGVRPDAEAAAVAEELEQSGYTVIRTLNGLHFTALGAADADGAPVKVRIITGRGIAVALDPVVATLLQPGIRYALLPPPAKDTHDPDGDGFEEVFVHRLVDGAAPCILVYRVLDSGFADPVPSGQYGLARPPSEPPWDAPLYCDVSAPAAPDAGGSDAASPAPP